MRTAMLAAILMLGFALVGCSTTPTPEELEKLAWRESVDQRLEQLSLAVESSLSALGEKLGERLDAVDGRLYLLTGRVSRLGSLNGRINALHQKLDLLAERMPAAKPAPESGEGIPAGAREYTIVLSEDSLQTPDGRYYKPVSITGPATHKLRIIVKTDGFAPQAAVVVKPGALPLIYKDEDGDGVLEFEVNMLGPDKRIIILFSSVEPNTTGTMKLSVTSVRQTAGDTTQEF